MALMLALIERLQTGKGQLIDVGMHDCLAVNGELANPYWFYPKAIVRRQTCRHAQPTPTAPALFESGDGRYVYFAQFVADTKQWKTLVEWMDTKGIATDVVGPEYDVPAFRQANFGHIQELVEVFFLLQTADEAYHDGQARGLPIGVLYSPDDLFENEHLLARDFFVDVEHVDGSSGRYPAAAIRFSQYSPVPTVRAPMLGEHTEELRGRGPTDGRCNVVGPPRSVRDRRDRRHRLLAGERAQRTDRRRRGLTFHRLRIHRNVTAYVPRLSAAVERSVRVSGRPCRSQSPSRGIYAVPCGMACLNLRAARLLFGPRCRRTVVSGNCTAQGRT